MSEAKNSEEEAIETLDLSLDTQSESLISNPESTPQEIVSPSSSLTPEEIQAIESVDAIKTDLSWSGVPDAAGNEQDWIASIEGDLAAEISTGEKSKAPLKLETPLADVAYYALFGLDGTTHEDLRAALDGFSEELRAEAQSWSRAVQWLPFALQPKPLPEGFRSRLSQSISLPMHHPASYRFMRPQFVKTGRFLNRIGITAFRVAALLVLVLLLILGMVIKQGHKRVGEFVSLKTALQQAQKEIRHGEHQIQDLENLFEPLNSRHLDMVALDPVGDGVIGSARIIWDPIGGKALFRIRGLGPFKNGTLHIWIYLHGEPQVIGRIPGASLKAEGNWELLKTFPAADRGSITAFDITLESEAEAEEPKGERLLFGQPKL